MKRVILLFVVLVASVVFGQQSASPAQPPDFEQKKTAVNLLRLINTAEMNYRSEKGRFANFQQLVEANLLSPQSTHIRIAMWPTGFNPANLKEPISGLALTLSPSVDGESYQVAVLTTKQNTELWGFYSTQDGLILAMLPIR